MDSEKVIKRDNDYVLHTYNRNPIALEKGHGLYAEGPEGQKYLDFTSGIGVNSLGYCDVDWAEAISEQAHKLQHTSNLYYTAPCGKLAKKLCKRTGMSKVFFGNSGAEANEGAIKAARKYSFDHYGKGRDVVITLVNSFHGRTIATLTATGQEVFHNYFGPFNEGFQYVPAGDLEALTELVDRHTCAVMLELVQGEGGVVALEPEYVQAVRKLCDDRDLVLIVGDTKDEVVFAALGALRLECAKQLDILDPKEFRFLWVTEFPMFEWSEEEGRYQAMHHPFTAPMLEDEDKMLTDKANCRARAYDIVLNGTELGGGSIRINTPEMQTKAFEALGISDEDIQERFGHLVNAFQYGAPPHGGLAYGLDRLVMLMTGASSIRDVIAFPKVQNASDLMMNCPDVVDEKQLDDLSIAVTRVEEEPAEEE